MGQKQVKTEQKKQLQDQQERWENDMLLPLQISGVLFALDLIFLQNLVQTSSLAGWKTGSLALFAIALPCLAANVLILHRMRTTKTVLPGKALLFLVIQLVGYLASIAGVWASIMDVSRWTGYLFLGVAIGCFLFCVNAYQKLDRIHADNTK